MKISRRSRTVKLYQGEYEPRIDELSRALVEAVDGEQERGKRFGEKSSAMQLAREHDALVAEADKTAVPVTVWAIGFRDFGRLMDMHEPRPDNEADQRFEVNMRTFPDALAEASLADPEVDYGEDVGLRCRNGRKKLEELGDISRVHYVKVREAAWDVNVSSDELPKFSAVSRLREMSETRSTSQSGGGSPPEG